MIPHSTAYQNIMDCVFSLNLEAVSKVLIFLFSDKIALAKKWGDV